ncbi:hypothetical protein J8273_3600 [Carpediemonas membranifera]|uniref:Uncharacterized protein n=1 Tax=Carpediemonas membranifera TaxID=201153 RepID=A0A8J6E1T6_9EUKA|nr:hypothetical protein J8273_3600 [Carpediemonas membranifera]|eukprot:KAG9393461.1 hypothetical protein J8273_3600 [Carpediemonas membranifera]
MSSASSSPSAIKDALISVFRASLVVTASISGDIPSLLQHAYSRHFGEQMPSIHNNKSTVTPTSVPSLESLLATLSKIPPLEPTAQALLDRARSILTSGPPLSMNVELADGEELPVAMHTLNQGAVWACLMGGGANPDLEDRVLEEAREKQPHMTDIHNRIRKALTPEAKCLWFLCRKFFFSLNVAEKDGKSYQCSCSGYYHHHMYMGRLFMLRTDYHAALTRARMPRALEVYSNEITHIARTPKGLWGWGDNGSGQLGFESSGFVDPTRLTFPACPKVAEHEASLPPWEKHRVVTGVSLIRARTFIFTPVGTVMAGADAKAFVGTVEDENRHLFHPVAVPTGFVADHIVDSFYTVILSMGDRQVIGGWNENGRLGLGHENEMTGFEELPFRVDRIIAFELFFNVFLSGRQLLFAGEVPRPIAQSGLLPGYSEDDKCLTATQLRFPERVKGFCCMFLRLLWVTEGRTHLRNRDKQYCMPFEATSFGGRVIRGREVYSLRDAAGQWFMEKTLPDDIAGVTRLVKCKVPTSQWEIIPVDVDPWAEQ